MADEDYFLFNGIHRRTGLPWAPELAGAPDVGRSMYLPPFVDPNDLAATGWGLVVAADDPDAERIRAALSPLLEKRRAESRGRAVSLTYKKGMSVYTFRKHHQDLYTSSGQGRAPHYLLLVGGPERIPFGFQADLAASHAVGRLHFDAIETYATYAQMVVAEETAASRPRQAVFWAADHPDDPSSQLTTTTLTAKVAARTRDAGLGFTCHEYRGRDATKRILGDRLQQGAPAFLFTSGHGLFFSCGDSDQRREQGALIAGDWGGPKSGPPDQDHYFSAADLDTACGAAPRGLISFHFACNSAGTPQFDDFYFQEDPRRRPALAIQPFVSALAQSLVGHPGGGALAFIGHVERTWISTFLWRRSGGQPHLYSDVVEALLRGFRVGAALDVFSRVSAEISTDLIRRIVATTGAFDPKRKAANMLGRICDLKAFVVIGDPAVRIGPSPTSDLVANHD